MDNFRHTFGSLAFRNGEFLHFGRLYPYSTGHRCRCIFDSRDSRKTSHIKRRTMFKINKIALALVSMSLGVLFSSYSYGVDTYNNKKTTTVEQTTVQTSTTTPRPVARKRAAPVTTTTSSTVTLTTKEGDLRKVLDEDALKKMSKSLCVAGFKARVGNSRKNVCQGKATAPDIAYSCVWDKKGSSAYAPTLEGPCSLDYSEHQGSIIITKADYTSSPPLHYGSEAECCFRAAQGPTTSTLERSPTTTTVVPKI